MKLTFTEIKNWKDFEDLAAAYFKKHKESDVINVVVEPSGMGSDGGRDILITLNVNDSLITFERKWVVQCKFYNKAVSKSHLSKVNIPTLIHEYRANGYLLICKTDVTSNVTRMFENLREKCKLGYDYLIWNGNDFISRIQVHHEIIKQFFPQYYSQLEKIDKRKALKGKG